MFVILERILNNMKKVRKIKFDVVGDLANNRFKFAETGIKPVFPSTAIQRASFTPLCNIKQQQANRLTIV